MKNQNSQNSVDKEINSQSSKSSQQPQGQSLQLKDQQQTRNKSNSSSQNSTFRKAPSVSNKNEKVQRPQSVTQRQNSIPKFCSSYSNEASKLGPNGNNRSQDDSYAVNSVVNSMNNSYCMPSNTSDLSNKPKQQNSQHQRGRSMQAISQASMSNPQQVNGGKAGQSLSQLNQAVPSGQSILSNIFTLNQQYSGTAAEEKGYPNVNQSMHIAAAAGSEFLGFGGQEATFSSQLLSMEPAQQSALIMQSGVAGNKPCNSAMDLQANSYLSNPSKQASQTSSAINKCSNINVIKQKPKQSAKPVSLKQKDSEEIEGDQDENIKAGEEGEEENEQNESFLQQHQLIEGWGDSIGNKIDADIQIINQNQGNCIIVGNNELEKLDLTNSNSSKHTSNSATSRSIKNQSNMSDDSLQDSKQESAANNSALISSSNNSSKVFKGSSNNSFVQNSCTSKVASANPRNDYIQSKEEIKESIRSKCSAKPRESHITQNMRHPIKPILHDESKNQILPAEERQLPLMSSSIQAIQKPSQDLSESLLKSSKTKIKQHMHRRGNTLSRSDADELQQFFEFQDNTTTQKAGSEEENLNLVQLENKAQSENMSSNLKANPLSFINPDQAFDFQIKNNDDDNHNDQDYQQDDQEEDLEIKKQVGFLNSDDSENEDKQRKGNLNSHPSNVYQQPIYHPIPTAQSQQQQQQQVSFHPHINPFIDLPNQSTPQTQQQQQQSFDHFAIPQQSSTPNQQLEFLNNKLGGGIPISIDQQIQFFAPQNQQQVINIPENNSTSPFQFSDFQKQSQQQGQSSFVLYDQPSHQHMQSLFNQGIKQPSPNMNSMIQFNQLTSSSPPVQGSQQQQQNFSMFQQHPQMQSMMCQLPTQHNVGLQQSQQTQSAQQQQALLFKQNQLNINQQGQQQMYTVGKNQRQHLQIQPTSLFSSNSNSTYHLQKQNCNLSQASTADSQEYMNTFRSGSSFGGLQDIQQELVVQMIQSKQQQLQNHKMRNQLMQQQSQVQQQQQQQSPQLNAQLNFYPHHLPQQEGTTFFQQPNNNQYLMDPYTNQPQFGQYPPSLEQYQQNQQIFSPEIFQMQQYPMQYMQIYLPQNHPSVMSQQIGQISPDKFGQVPPQPPTMYQNPQLLNSADISKIKKSQFFGQQPIPTYNKPSHSKQLSCQQFGQYDQQSQMQQQQQQQQQQVSVNQKQLQPNNLHQQLKNNKNSTALENSNNGSNLSGNMSSNNNLSGNTSMISNQSSKGKKKLEIKDEDISYDINIDKIGEDLRTTVYIKNIPNKYQLNCVLQTIEKNHKDTFDFFYLPIDFQNKCNVGYAFINFIKPEFIREFYLEFNGQKWKKFNSDKICSLKYATIQGIPQLKEHFMNSSVMNQREKKFKPVFIQISNMIDKQRQQQNESGYMTVNHSSEYQQQFSFGSNKRNNNLQQGNNDFQSNNCYQNKSNNYSSQNPSQNNNNNNNNTSNNNNNNNSNSNNNNNSNNSNNNYNNNGQNYTNYHRKNNSNSSNNYSNRHYNSNVKNYNSNKQEYVQKQ